MTKIVLLSTSPRSKGNTAYVINEMANTIREFNVEADVFSFAGKDIRSCRGCNGCKETGKCVIDDGLNEMVELLKQADGLIVGAPVYFGTARGDCMNFLQRLGKLNFVNNRFLTNKVGGPVAVGRRGGHTSTIQEMLMFFFINGMTVPGSSYWNMGFGLNPGDVANDEEGINTLKLFAANVAELAIKLKG